MSTSQSTLYTVHMDKSATERELMRPIGHKYHRVIASSTRMKHLCNIIKMVITRVVFSLKINQKIWRIGNVKAACDYLTMSIRASNFMIKSVLRNIIEFY